MPLIIYSIQEFRFFLRGIPARGGRFEADESLTSSVPEGPSPRDSVEKLTVGEVNFCFSALFSDYAEWSEVELCTPECSYSRKSGLSEVVGPCLCALCSREARITRNEK
ncbi:hypothetical protein ALC62_09856 [Cyphomyrmex costatus]|uniref:Uncharacterized protein n=1 Tax=Cyphomyrmex costatus TaxID=456900 RepID=A0A151IF12_9HYME|nr:hypothetical protein ALC62_09856 [Cyphomyrmex costatus]